MFSMAPKGAMPFVHNVPTSSPSCSTSLSSPSPQHFHGIGGSVGMKGSVFHPPSHSTHISTSQHLPSLPKLIMSSPTNHSPTSSSHETNVVTLRTDDMLQKDHSWKTLLKAIFRWKTQSPQKPSSSKIEVSGNKVLISSSLLKTPSETPLGTSPSSPMLHGPHHQNTLSFNTSNGNSHSQQHYSSHNQSVKSSILRTNRGSSSSQRGNRTSSSFHLIRNSQARLESIDEGNEVSSIGKSTTSVSDGRPNSELLKRKGLRLDFQSGHLWEDASPLDLSLSSTEASYLPFGEIASPGCQTSGRVSADGEVVIQTCKQQELEK